MDNANLYTIENGFDLHHGMQTGYDDFREHHECTNKNRLVVINHIDFEKIQCIVSCRSDSSQKKYKSAMRLLGIKPCKFKLIELNNLSNGGL